MLNNINKGIFSSLKEIENEVPADIKLIKIEQIETNPNNFYSIEDIEKLADDIKEHGLIHNLAVRELQDGRYQLISGERRYRALKHLGYNEVPCKIIDNVDDIDAEIMLIQANALSRELTDEDKRKQVARLEELFKIKKANKELKGSITKNISDVIGITDRQVRNYQKINKSLIPELQELFDKKEITMSDAIDLSSLNEEQQKQIYTLLKLNMNNIKSTINELQVLIKEKDNELENIIKEKIKILEEKNKLEETITEKDNEINKISSEIEEIKKNMLNEIEKKNKDAIDKLYKQIEEMDKKRKAIEEENEKLKKEMLKISSVNNNEGKENIEIKTKADYILKTVKNLLKDLEELINKADEKTREELKENIYDIISNLI